eukprot:jgi/Botrbrau1/7621/Bobra.0159s0070.1
MSVGVTEDGPVQAPLPLEHSNSSQWNIDGFDGFIDNLIESIGPQHTSEGRRKTVIDFVRREIVLEFSARQVEIGFAVYGSVPLKTYLPDGDIDIALFHRSGRPVQHDWQETVLTSLGKVKANPSPGNLRISSIEKIEAEVKLVKCIVDGLIVDISFNTSNGICTLAFLEDVDRKVGRNHLFQAQCHSGQRLVLL